MAASVTASPALPTKVLRRKHEGNTIFLLLSFFSPPFCYSVMPLPQNTPYFPSSARMAAQGGTARNPGQCCSFLPVRSRAASLPCLCLSFLLCKIRTVPFSWAVGRRKCIECKVCTTVHDMLYVNATSLGHLASDSQTLINISV